MDSGFCLRFVDRFIHRVGGLSTSGVVVVVQSPDMTARGIDRSPRRRRIPLLLPAAMLVASLCGGGQATAGTGAGTGRDELSCRAGLAARGAKTAALPAIADGDCGSVLPLRLTGVRGVAIRRPATTTCAMADALDRWTLEVVVPEARRFLGAAPEAVLVGTSYQCRTRKRIAGAQLSEHAYANAVDVHGFVFAGRGEVAMKPHRRGSPEALFLAAVRRRACDYFTTVLGPGTDATHADHLHLDMRARSGGYRICQ